MNPAGARPPSSSERVPSTERTLRKLFLTLFLRGRSSRGLSKQSAPKSVGRKLASSLVLYVLLGLFALSLRDKPVFALAVFLHSMTFVFLGMFVASSAGEILFNKEEADILLHRPIGARALLWAKIRVLVEVSLWLAGALNLAGFVIGVSAPDGGWTFVAVHAVSTALEALFCTGSVVLAYQLCLRWFGRERLEGLMTAAQVVISVAAVLSGQLFSQFMIRTSGIAALDTQSWWIGLLPPAWFASFDDALAGSMAANSWWLAALAPIAAGVVLWVAFGKLARGYETGLQMLNETISRRARRRDSRRLLAAIADVPPMRWWLRDPVARASFLLTAAYLARDREVKLRVYPGLAPMLVIPMVFLMRQPGGSGPNNGGFSVAFVGSYLGLIPLLGLSLVQYSQQWHAADIFRAAPLPGPAPLCHGARHAVLCFLTLPAAAIFMLIAWLASGGTALLLLMLPGAVALPVYSLIPSLGGGAVPLSSPPEDGKSFGRGLIMIPVMFISMALSGIATWSWSAGWFWWFLLIEALIAAGLYAVLRRSLTTAGWPSSE